MSASQVAREFVRLFNAGDPDGLAALYAEDAVNHQAPFDPVTGRAAIREMFAKEFAAADMVCIVEAIHDAGDTAILEWRDTKGLRGCGIFTVKHGLIISQRGYWDRLSFLKLHGLKLE